MVGRRTSYLHPVRMYVFTSAIFFLLFFTFFKPKDAIDINNNTDKPLNAKQRGDYMISLQNRLKKDSSNKLLLKTIALVKDTARLFTAKDTVETEIKKELSIEFGDKGFKSFEEYDSTQKTLPPSKRDGWLLRRFVKMGINITSKYRENPKEAVAKLFEGFFHRLPYMLFVSLPLFAFILKLVYIRRKQFYFADHGVFTIHLYIFSFITLLVAFGLGKLKELTGWGFINVIVPFLFIWLVSYLYIAMHNFYKQRWGKTFLKFLLVVFSSLIMMLILFIFFLLFSAATI
jgi:Protein of unknown function (DUF3667)